MFAENFEKLMEGNLVIVESPTKAREIGEFLKKEAVKYTVVSSKGHIRDLSEKRLSVDVADGFRPEYEIPSDKRKVVSELKALSDKAETVYLASDPDREGEAIAWHLQEVLGLDPARTRRITYHEITKTAVLEALKNPRGIDMNLVDAQQARRVLDRLVGFELSPVLWRKIQPKLSAGRVQSVALRLIVDREKEIMAFRNEAYYRVEGDFHPAGAPASVHFKALLDTRFSTEEQARKFLEDSIGANYCVESVEKKEGVRCPAPPFTTSTLQQEASRKLRFPVNTTMRIAQQLYERGLITYMRTDSTNLSALALGTAKQFILEQFGPEYSKVRQYKTRSKGAQEAHEAIRPTFISNTDIEGTAQEKKLYQLIWKRTLASQMADARILQTQVKISSDRRSERFGATAAEILFDGFLRLYSGSAEEEETGEGEVILPEIRKGDKMEDRSITAQCKFTAAPPRYSQGTLTRKLEELGIGRPSTWSTIVPTLSAGRGYITEGDKEGRKEQVENLTLSGGVIRTSSKSEIIGAEKRKLMPQEIGIIVSDFLVKEFPEIMDYDFTARVEEDFDRIAEGQAAWTKTLSAFYGPFHKRIDEVMAHAAYSKVERVIGIDPVSGESLTARYGRFGAYIQKGDPEKKQFASLGKDQLIETITLEEALKLFALPRTVGELEGIPVIAAKGRFGAYLKYGDRNVSLPRGKDPLSVTLEECAALLSADQAKPAQNAVIKEFGDIQVINGRYGPYLKKDGSNYKIPNGTAAETLTEADCLKIIGSSEPTKKSFRRFSKKK